MVPPGPWSGVENDDLQAVQAFAAAGLGIVLMNELTIPTPRRDVTVRPLRHVSVGRRVYAGRPQARRTGSLHP